MTLEVEKEWTKFSDATVKLSMAYGFQRSSWDWVGLYKVINERHFHIKLLLTLISLKLSLSQLTFFTNYSHYIIIIITRSQWHYNRCNCTKQSQTFSLPTIGQWLDIPALKLAIGWASVAMMVKSGTFYKPSNVVKGPQKHSLFYSRKLTYTLFVVIFAYFLS